MLLVDKTNSHDKSFKGDFNFILLKFVSNNQHIFTGVQIINRSIFEGIKKKTFSMNEVWDQMVKEKKLLGQEARINKITSSTRWRKS